MGEANLVWVEWMWTERCGEYLTIWRRCCCISFYFRGLKILTRYFVCFHVKYNIDP